MLRQTQGTRVRISSREKIINMSQDYLPSDSKCSCSQCDSIACFKIRYTNSGIPCTCTECDSSRCLTWETGNEEVAPDILKYLINVPEHTLNYNTNDTKKITHPTNTTNTASDTRKDEIKLSYLDNDLQNNNYGDSELKEVFTEEKKRIEKCGTLRKLTQNIYMDDPDIKDTSSNEKSDIIESGVIHLENNISDDLENEKISARDVSDPKKCCSKCNKNLTRNDVKNKQISSNKNMILPKNENTHPETKELFSRKIGKCCSLETSTNNIRSDLPEVYQIFTNEKKNIIKCCNISKDLEKKCAYASEDKRGNTDNKINRRCNESEDLQNGQTDTMKPSVLDINTTTRITNIKCDFEPPMADKGSDIDVGNYTKFTYKDVSHTKNKMNMNKNNKSYEKYFSRLQSVAISYGRQDYENSRAELSAQIMNVPYEEFKDSLSRRQSSTDFNTYRSSFKLEKMDILGRLKEIYKACSCKVCECIAGKSLFSRSEACNCEPCDCDDCHGHAAKLQKRITDAPHSGCPCVKCDRKDCRGVVKSSRDYVSCDCKPCDCVRCTVSFTKPCSCTPCQCETCNTSIFIPQTITVANAAESFRQSNCDCETCECRNCINDDNYSTYSAMTSNLTRQVSSGKISYGNWNFDDCSNDACQLSGSNYRCDSRHKAIRKNMKEKRSDYDIRGVYVKENKYGKKTMNNNNHDTITMFALSNNCPNSLFNYSNAKKSCECDVCECIVCKDKGKGVVTNGPLSMEIDKPNCNFNTNPLNDCKCSPCECQVCKSCKSLPTEKAESKFCAKTSYDASRDTNSKHLDHNFKIINNNEKYTFKKTNPSCMCKSHEGSECKHRGNLYSDDSTNKDGGYLPDNDKFYLLKKGKLLTPSMFENKELTFDSSHIHIKPEKDSLRENKLGKKILTMEQNTKLCRSLSRHNFDHDYKQDTTNKTPESSVKDISRNSSSLNPVPKVESTTKIFKNNSLDINNAQVSKISKTNLQNYDSNTILLDDSVTRATAKPSSLSINKKIEYKKEVAKSSQTSLLDRQVEDFLSKTMCSSNANVHFSSAKSMSLVKLLCQERNLNTDKRVPKFLQSLEKIPLKKLILNEKNLSNMWDKTLNNDRFFDSFSKDNYSYPLNNNLLINMDRDKSGTINFEKKKEDTDLQDKKVDNCVINVKKTVKPSVPKTSKQIKTRDVSNHQMVEKKPNNYNKNIRAKGSAASSTANKPRSNAKTASSNLRSINKMNTKRHLEAPALVDAAASAVNFNESDKHIYFEQSFKQLKEVNFGIGENKKASPILRKNFFFSPEFLKNEGMYSIPLLELDVKSAVKSASLQTNTLPYYPGTGFGNKALTRLKDEVNELLYSPLLQSSQTTDSQTVKFPSKSEFDLELNSNMSDATSQTKRMNIAVDKEINCNIPQSKAAKTSCDGLKASIVGLRKVSDHTVLLRWTMPRDVHNIQGYELQVDGRPVQKILNPSRCMAVLTCLPHCERLLLTVRTITDTDTCRTPVTTVVYTPKKNKSGLL